MQWQFVQHDLGYRRGGEIVEITLSGSAANVRLMDSSNFSSYKSGRQHFMGCWLERNHFQAGDKLKVPQVYRGH